MKYTIYKNEVGQLMAMEGHCEFDGVVAKVFDLEGSTHEVYKQPETPLEHYWFNLGHQSNKIAEENNYLRSKLTKAREALSIIASGELAPSLIKELYVDQAYQHIAEEALKEIGE